MSKVIPQSDDPVMNRLVSALNKNPKAVEEQIEAAWCSRPGGLYRFVKLMWPTVEPARKFVEGWHIKGLCDHLEAINRGEIRRLLANVPPGSCKSLITNVFFPAWEWGPMKMPHLRYLTFSYSQSLTIRDNVRFRQIITSEVYKKYWGDQFGPSTDQFSLVKVGNNKSGWKIASSLGGVSTGERGDRILCFSYDTRVLTDKGNIEIGKVVEERLPVRVAGWDGQCIVWQEISGYRKNPGQQLVKVHFAGGKSIVCTPDHKIFTEQRGYINASDLTKGECVLSVRDACKRSDAFLDSMRDVREAHNKISVPFEARQRSVFLQSELFWEISRPRREKPKLQRWIGSFKLRGMRNGVPCKASGSQDCEILFTAMPVKDQRGSRTGSAGQNLRCVQPYLSSNALQDEVLFSYVQTRRAVLVNDGTGFSFVHKWGMGRRPECSISGPVDGLLQKGDPVSGREPLYKMRYRTKEDSSRSSYRLYKGQSLSGEPDLSLRELSRRSSWNKGTTGNVERETILFVERLSEREEYLYDITTRKTHNYFANDILVHNCDDPNSVAEAESEVIRESTNQFYLEVLPTRTTSPSESAFITIQQRTHASDVSGTILGRGGMGYTHYMVQMEFDGLSRDTEIGWTDPRTEEGELMWPEMYPPDVVEDLKQNLGRVAYAGQFQQIPVPRGGAIFEFEHWQPWPKPGRDENRWIDHRGKILWPPFNFTLVSVDTAFTEKESNDYCALVVLSMFSGDQDHTAMSLVRGEEDPIRILRVEHDNRPKVMLRYAWRKRVPLMGPPEIRPVGLTDEEWNSPEWRIERQSSWGLVEWVADTCRRYEADELIIETQAAGIPLHDELRKLPDSGDWGVRLIPARGGRGALTKVERAWAVQHLFANGRVYVPRYPDTGLGPQWAEDVLQEASLFPRDKHDDYVDCVIAGITFLRETGMLQRGDEHDREAADMLMYRSSNKPLYDV